MLPVSAGAAVCPADPLPSEIQSLFGKRKVQLWDRSSRKRVGPEWTLESADTPAAQARGMMYRKKMKPVEGMVFVFPDVQRRSFWMKNTCVPLDMVFVSEVKREGPNGPWFVEVQGVLTAEPLTLLSRSLPVESRAVIELAAGEARRRGWDRGQTLILEGVEPVRAR